MSAMVFGLFHPDNADVDGIPRGIDEGVANSILIKFNQIGTLSETLDAIAMADAAGYTSVISHR